MKAFLVAFITVFLAEIGDKTQLATMLLSARSSNRVLVFMGAGLALLLAAGLGVLAGKIVGDHLPLKFIRYASGVLFIAVGIAILTGKF
jgi:putative Ca2+/H+ antiporter (TMEM165/GDT1 family)